jgi:hypothetical protein
MTTSYVLTATVGGNEFDFASEGYFVLGTVGLGQSPVLRLETSGAQQHGATSRGFFLRPRNFALALGFEATSRNEYWNTRRQDLVRLFRPNASPIQLKFTLPTSEVYQIDCHYIGGLDFPYTARVAYLESVTLELRAPDPTLYNPVESNEIFALGAGGSSFTVPLPIPWPIGASTLDVTRPIAYTGSWSAYPIIRIVGPITNAKIENLTTEEVLDFTGTTITAGHWYEIDTRYGYKQVVDDLGNIVTDDLTDDSDLGTFHLEAPEGVVASKTNDIRVTGSSVTSATEVYMRYNTRYTGI